MTISDELANLLVEELPIGVCVLDLSLVKTFLEERELTDTKALARYLDEKQGRWLEIDDRCEPVYMNREALRIFGVDSFERFKALRTEAWRTCEYSELYAARMTSLLAGLKGEMFEYITYRHDQSPVYIREMLTLAESDTEWNEVISVIEDISEYQRRRRENSRQHALDVIPKIERVLPVKRRH